jgi:hypothetical protein
MKGRKKKLEFPRYQSGGRQRAGKNSEEPIVTKLESKPLFFKDLEDEFIEIMHTMEVKYFGVKR